MRTIALFIITMVAGLACTGLETAKAVPLSGVAADAQLKLSIEEVGWRRRWYRGYAYPVPYAYYPPAYTYYPPPPPVYYAPAYPAYPYYRPYGYYPALLRSVLIAALAGDKVQATLGTASSSYVL